MVIDVTMYNKPMSFTEAIHQFEMSCSDIINEMQYNILQVRYDYLVETGNELMNVPQPEKKSDNQKETKARRNIGQIIKTAIQKAIQAITNLKDKVVAKIRSMIADFKRKREARKTEAINRKIDKIIRDLEDINDDVNAKCEKSKSDIIDLGSDEHGLDDPDTMEQLKTKINGIMDGIKGKLKEDIDKANNIIDVEWEVVPA